MSVCPHFVQILYFGTVDGPMVNKPNFHSRLLPSHVNLGSAKKEAQKPREQDFQQSNCTLVHMCLPSACAHLQGQEGPAQEPEDADICSASTFSPENPTAPVAIHCNRWQSLKRAASRHHHLLTCRLGHGTHAGTQNSEHSGTSNTKRSGRLKADVILLFPWWLKCGTSTSKHAEPRHAGSLSWPFIMRSFLLLQERPVRTSLPAELVSCRHYTYTSPH